MHDMTLANLHSAFAGESQAHMRYGIYADRAEKDDFSSVAKLFRAIRYAEEIHATNHFVVLRKEVGDATTVAVAGFGLGKTAENLKIAIAGEEFEVAEMYPAYKAVANAQEEKAALRSFDWAWQAEQTHAALYKEALDAVEQGKDPEFAAIYVCPQCGHTIVGEPPEKCPICGMAREKYVKFD